MHAVERNYHSLSSFFIHPLAFLFLLLSMAFRSRTVPTAPFSRNSSFSTGLCDCECCECCYSVFCFWCLVAQNSARLDNNPEPFCCFYPGSSRKNRKQAKAQFGIRTGCCTDLCSCIWNECSEMQIQREITIWLASSSTGPSYQRML